MSDIISDFEELNRIIEESEPEESRITKDYAVICERLMEELKEHRVNQRRASEIRELSETDIATGNGEAVCIRPE